MARLAKTAEMVWEIYGDRAPKCAAAACPLEAWAYSAEARAEKRLARELLQQGRELLDWVQAGLTELAAPPSGCRSG